MSSYLSFPNNLKEVKDHMGWYDKLQNLFPINSISFQRKTKLTPTPYNLQ